MISEQPISKGFRGLTGCQRDPRGRGITNTLWACSVTIFENFSQEWCYMCFQKIFSVTVLKKGTKSVLLLPFKSSSTLFFFFFVGGVVMSFYRNEDVMLRSLVKGTEFFFYRKLF